MGTGEVVVVWVYIRLVRVVFGDAWRDDGGVVEGCWGS